MSEQSNVIVAIPTMSVDRVAEEDSFPNAEDIPEMLAKPAELTQDPISPQ